MIDIITPTGDRPICFNRCVKWMLHQTIKESVNWIIVDDGIVDIPKLPKFPKNWKINHIKRTPSTPGTNTQSLNLLTALPHVKSSKVVMVEDDDYYHPDWLVTASTLLNSYDIIGKSSVIYYNIPSKSYYFTNYFKDYPEITNPMVQTAFKSSYIPILVTICKKNIIQIDNELWKAVEGSKYLLDTPESLYLVIGIKGMPGRPGITKKHTMPLPYEDPFLENFKHFIGENHVHYLKYFT